MRAALDPMDPSEKQIVADPVLVERYAAIRPTSDDVARAILGLADRRRDARRGAGVGDARGDTGGPPR